MVHSTVREAKEGILFLKYCFRNELDSRLVR